MVAAAVLALFTAWTAAELSILITLSILGILLFFWLGPTVLGWFKRNDENFKVSRSGRVKIAAVGLVVGAVLGVVFAEKSVDSRAQELERVTSVFRDNFPGSEVSDVVVSGKEGRSSTANLSQGDCSWTVTLGGSGSRTTYKVTNLVAGESEPVAQQRGTPLEEAVAFIAESCAA